MPGVWEPGSLRANTRVSWCSVCTTARPPPPAQRPARRASPASTRYASCHEPHAPPQPDVAPAVVRSPRRSCDKHSHHQLLHRGFYLHPTRQDDSPGCDTSEHPGTRKRGWQCWGTAPTFAPERIGSGAVSPKGCPATQRELCGEAARDLPPPLRQPCVADITGRSARKFATR